MPPWPPWPIRRQEEHPHRGGVRDCRSQHGSRSGWRWPAGWRVVGPDPAAEAPHRGRMFPLTTRPLPCRSPPFLRPVSPASAHSAGNERHHDTAPARANTSPSAPGANPSHHRSGYSPQVPAGYREHRGQRCGVGSPRRHRQRQRCRSRHPPRRRIAAGPPGNGRHHARSTAHAKAGGRHTGYGFVTRGWLSEYPQSIPHPGDQGVTNGPVFEPL
jgi:hypothetical protein